MPTPSNHWADFARQWNRLGSPLRPCAEDVANIRRGMGSAPGRCLLLGVTPELADISPRLIAVDNCAAMIGALWNPGREVVLGDWLNLPFAEESFDTIIGDGCLTLLAHPGQHDCFFQQLDRILVPGGKALIRLFCGPQQAERRDFVCAEAAAGKIKSFHAFKWRLSMAIAADAPDRNLCVAETCATFDRLIPDRTALAAVTGWTTDEIETIDLYRNSEARYSFATLEQVRGTIPPTLRETGLLQGAYELAERCPVLMLSKTD